MQHIILNPETAAGANKNGPVVVLGYFDGVHTAHRHLIDMALAKAAETGSQVLVWTFSRLSKSEKGSLTTKEERIFLFRKYGAGSVIFENFDELKDLDGEAFFKRHIADMLQPSAVVCGFNFRFGKNAAWGADELVSMSRECSIPCLVAEEFVLDGITVSSTEIKRLLSAGDAETANRMLGYEYSVTSEIKHGQMIGRSIGAPTVNQLIPAAKFRPSYGVYVVRNEFPETGEIYNGIANLGYRPTVNSDRRRVTLESHLFGYSGNAYGNTVKTSFIKKLRDEIRFPDRNSLSEQVRKDEETALQYFKDYT
ncbi:MAG: riboflavin biosynthesis protein RibF [Clostridia bacterium]|nr:riboflavin biosynthesis protein RibF [Clostridia bacterium]